MFVGIAMIDLSAETLRQLGCGSARTTDDHLEQELKKLFDRDVWNLNQLADFSVPFLSDCKLTDGIKKKLEPFCQEGKKPYLPGPSACSV
jgi:hypothetical protein